MVLGGAGGEMPIGSIFRSHTQLSETATASPGMLKNEVTKFVNRFADD